MPCIKRCLFVKRNFSVVDALYKALFICLFTGKFWPMLRHAAPAPHKQGRKTHHSLEKGKIGGGGGELLRRGEG